VFPLVFDLERINSEITDKRRDVAPEEQERIAMVLNEIERIVKTNNDL
jgi:hypothetical protein